MKPILPTVSNRSFTKKLFKNNPDRRIIRDSRLTFDSGEVIAKLF